MQDLYQILGLKASATPAEIKAAFKRLAMQYHPDRNPNNAEAEERFKEINQAYQILSDEVKKYHYDSYFYYAPTPTPPPTSTTSAPKRNPYERATRPNSNMHYTYAPPEPPISKALKRRIEIGTIIGGVLFVFFAIFLRDIMNYQTSKGHLERAKAYWQKGEVITAMVLISKSLEFYRENPETYLLRADIYMKQYYNYIYAISDLDLAIQLSDKVAAEIWFKRGFCYMKILDFRRATQDFSQAIKAEPKHGDSYFYRGIAKTQLKNMKNTDFCRDFEQAQQLGVAEATYYWELHCQTNK